MKKRVVSIELLRMLAMMMVVMLHYLDKGDILPALTGEIGVAGYTAWAMESLSIVAVNVYMLISGYFLVESGFKSKRLVELICQVLFYTVLIPVVLTALGVIHLRDFSLYNVLLNILPVQMNQYWFITAYVIMYLFSPVLSSAVKSMKREQLEKTILGLLLFFSLSKSLLPVELAIDNRGNDCIWFLCVFLVAAYIRLYGIRFFTEKNGFKRGLLVYLAGCAGIFCLTFAVRIVYLKTGSLDHFIGIGFDYNHVLNLLAAVGLFYTFLHLKLSSEGILAKVIYGAAPYSLGVYLFHEQLQIRYLWPKWLGAEYLAGSMNPIMVAAGSILAVLALYIAGTFVDACRGCLFRTATALLSRRKKHRS